MKIGHYPDGSVEWHNNVQRLADALERLARENASLRDANRSFASNAVCRGDRVNDLWVCPEAPCEYCLQWLARRTERAEAERNRCTLLARVRSEKIGEQQKEIDTLTAIVRAADMMRRHFVTYAGDQWVNASMARDAYDAARAKVKP